MKEISIGNDIISLANTDETRTTNKRFYSKFLCETEAALYKQQDASGLSFVNYIWLCWSIKESIFKFQKRIIPGLIFSPLKIILPEILPPLANDTIFFKEGIIEQRGMKREDCFCCFSVFDSKIFYSRSIITKSFIHTIVCNEFFFDDVHWGIKLFETVASQSDEVRSFAVNKCKIFLDQDVLHFEKSQSGFPYLNNYPNLFFSFSHCENLAAYAYIDCEKK